MCLKVQNDKKTNQSQACPPPPKETSLNSNFKILMTHWKAKTTGIFSKATFLLISLSAGKCSGC